MKNPPLTTRTTDAIASFLYELMRDHVPTGIVEQIVVGCEHHNKGAAILHGPLGPYAVDLSERLRQTSKEMHENDPIGTVGCPVGPPGATGVASFVSVGGAKVLERKHDVEMGDDFMLGEMELEDEGLENEGLIPGMVWVAGDDGALYTATAGDPSHDYPEARARALLAHECAKAELPLSRVIRLRKELDNYVQRWNSASSFPKTEKDHEEFKLMNTEMLRLGIDDYLEKPRRVTAAALHARSAPLLARIGKDDLLIRR